jgi:hypothetical protein
MAKVKLGAIAGQVSGSIGTQTWSHNRYGAYVRNRSIPVQPGSAVQLQRRAAMALHSSAWQDLSATQRLSWKVWAENNPIVDRLGDKRILPGHAAYVQLNSRLSLIPAAAISDPPIVAAPDALTSVSIAASVATQNVVVTFAATPLGANDTICLWACVTPTATINYVKNLMRFIACGSGAQTSPFTTSAVATTCGNLTLGETVIVYASVIGITTGQISPPREARCTVVA